MDDILYLMRPRQWVKNIFIFAGLIFSRQFYSLDSVRTSIFAFLVFCVLSSGIYVFNDIIDASSDRAHPAKCNRPLAAGRMQQAHAWILASVLLAVAFLCAWLLGIGYFAISICYCVMMMLYTLKVKEIVILDVLFVAVGYVLRAIAGAVVIDVAISSWLLLCTLLLALFLVISKRRVEIIVLGDKAAEYRKILVHYPITLLDQMIAIVTSACVVSYCLYTLASETVTKLHTRTLILTVPFVLYGIFRYLYLTYEKSETDMPDKILFSDAPLLMCLVLWVVTCIVILAVT